MRCLPATLVLVASLAAALPTDLPPASPWAPVTDYAITPQKCISELLDEGLILNKYTNEQGTDIVRLHNSFRSKVAKGEVEGEEDQPTAGDMREMTWDNKLVEELQNSKWLFAELCGINKDIYNDSIVDRLNIFLKPGSEISSPLEPKYKIHYEEAINVWFEEVKNFHPEDLPSFNGTANRNSDGKWGAIVDDANKKIGDYTQLVWAATHRVGCVEYAIQNEIKNETYKDETYKEIQFKVIACNYWPTGNSMGKSIYKDAEACTACPECTKCSDGNKDGLCKKVEGECKENVRSTMAASPTIPPAVV